MITKIRMKNAPEISENWVFVKGNDMSTTFLQQILSVRLLLIVTVGAKM